MLLLLLTLPLRKFALCAQKRRSLSVQKGTCVYESKDAACADIHVAAAVRTADRWWYATTNSMYLHGSKTKGNATRSQTVPSKVQCNEKPHGTINMRSIQIFDWNQCLTCSTSINLKYMRTIAFDLHQFWNRKKTLNGQKLLTVLMAPRHRLCIPPVNQALRLVSRVCVVWIRFSLTVTSCYSSFLAVF